MDILGARHLAARLRAGVRAGQRVELVDDEGVAELHVGDCGVVSHLQADGGVVVAWERGFERAIAPSAILVRSR